MVSRKMENICFRASNDWVQDNETWRKNSVKDKPKFEFIGSFKGLASIGEIFTVTSIEGSKKGSDMHRDSRCWGWFPTEAEAKKAVKKNAGDMFEMSYTHIVIEKVPAGIVVMAEAVHWYEWTMTNTKTPYKDGKWVKCQQPKWAEGTINWSLG